MNSDGIDALRLLLREKFPAAHAEPPRERETQGALGAPFSLEFLAPGSLSEVVSDGPGSGLGLLIELLLSEPEEGTPHPRAALIDGADAFDPGSHTLATCSALLWVRCGSASEAMKAADLIVRDGNLPLVLLDTSGLPRRELDRVPASSWWRLRQLAGRGGGRLVVLAEAPLVPAAAVRLRLSAGLSLPDWDGSREEVLEKLKAAASLAWMRDRGSVGRG